MNKFIADYALYQGKEKDVELPLYEFSARDEAYFVLEADEGVTNEQLRNIRDELAQQIQAKKPTSLSEFLSLVTPQLSILADVSYGFAGGLLSGGVLYLVTAGTGRVFVKRLDEVSEIIEGDSNASGYLQDEDLFVFTTRRFYEVVPHESLVDDFASSTPKDIVTHIAGKEASANNRSTALFVRFSAQAVDTEQKEDNMDEAHSSEPLLTGEETEGERQTPSMIAPGKPSILATLQTTPRKRLITIIAAVVLFVVLVWSVGFGYQRRQNAAREKKIEALAAQVNAKIAEAEDIALVNLNRSVELLDEARSEVSLVKQELGEHKKEEILRIELSIIEADKKITRKNEVTSSVFWELALARKGATAQSLYLEGTSLGLLDTKGGIVFLLDVEKKSVRTLDDKEVDNTRSIGLYDGSVYLTKSDGVYKGEESERIEKVIEEDEWGEIEDIVIYNGNVYLLDGQKDEVYKYLVAEAGYSAKQSYFKEGQSPDLALARGISIDGSLYVLSKNTILKYTSGLRDGFSLSLPEDNYTFNQLFTSRDVEKLYLLDSTQGKVVVAEKNGKYSKQVESSVLKDASDIVVLEGDKTLIVLKGDKLYSIEL